MCLAESKSLLIDEIERLQKREKMLKARKGTDTAAITRKSSELTRVYVTQAVGEHFTQECEVLRLGSVTLKDSGAAKGKLRNRPALLGASKSISVRSVLSEGEQTALGLAGFFTETFFDGTRSAVVLDDPITSLDHERRALVAKRIVEQAKDRQVIVFTHDASFVGDLMRCAEDASVPVSDRWVYRQNGSAGLCAEKHPWKVKDVAQRVNTLKEELARIKRNEAAMDAEAYDEACAAWAGKLSEAWERAISVEIVGQVTDRASLEVRPKMVRILALFTSQDNDEFQQGYSRCSQWARRHDKDPLINYVPPSVEDMDMELKRLQEWFGRVKKYRNAS
jgi:hypothetical protein